MNKLRYTLPLLVSVSSVQAVEIEPMIYVDSVVYGDSVHGKGSEYLQEALGVYNVHSDEAADEHEGHSHGGLEKGAHIRSIEAGAKVEVSEKLDGRIKAVVSPEEAEAEIEEAWVRYRPSTKTLLKAGKFLSNFGQHNQHPHEWDFVQQNLPTQMLLDGGLINKGLQAEWRPTVGKTELQTGIELLEGGNKGIAAQLDSVKGYIPSTNPNPVDINFTEQPKFPQVGHVYLKAKQAINEQHSVAGGVSYLHSRQHQELHHFHPGINDADHGLEGKANMWGIHTDYNYESGKAAGVGDINLKAEYLRQNKDLHLRFHETKPWLVNQPRDLYVDGYTVQGTYKLAPKWQLGLRHERVGATHEARRPSAPPFPTQTSYFDDMQRNTLAVTWQPKQQHKIRLELARSRVNVGEDINNDGKDDNVTKKFNQAMLQYQWSLDSGHEHHHEH
jgi:hypothetical protein